MSKAHASPVLSVENNRCDVGCGVFTPRHSLAALPTFVYRYHGVCNVGVLAQLVDVVLHPTTVFYCVGEEFNLVSSVTGYREFVLVSQLPLERLRTMMPSVPNISHACASYEPDFVVDCNFVAHVMQRQSALMPRPMKRAGAEYERSETPGLDEISDEE